MIQLPYEWYEQERAFAAMIAALHTSAVPGRIRPVDRNVARYADATVALSSTD
jgi:hypothetical protein